MKIAQLAPPSNTKLYHSTLNKNNYNHFNNSNTGDVFIKSSQNITFQGGKFQQKYGPLSKEMTEYIMQSPEIKKDDIQKIVQQYSPQTKFYTLGDLKTDRSISEGTRGYTKIPTNFIIKGNKIEVEISPKSIYTEFLQGNPTETERILLAGEILHECTHCLQEESKDKTSTQDFLNRQLKSSKNLNSFIQTIQKAPEAFSEVENFMLYILEKSGEITDPRIPHEISKKDTNIDSIFQKQNKKGAAESFKGFIIMLINRNFIQDKDCLLNYLILKAENEAEAYKNQYGIIKSLLKISGPTDLELRIDAYQKIKEAATALKGQKLMF